MTSILSFCRQYAITPLVVVIFTGAAGGAGVVQMLDAAQAAGLQTPQNCAAAAVENQCVVGSAFQFPQANALNSYERCFARVLQACAASDAAQRP